MAGIVTQPKSFSRPSSTLMKKSSIRFSNEDTTQDDSNSKSSKSRSLTAHDWECYKQKNFFDDGTMTFFWRAHTFITLFGLTCVLVYVAIFESPLLDPEYNAKRGLIAVILVFLLLGVTQIPDAAFLRPHPALWRFVFCLTIVYELSLIFILFQSPNDGRKMLQYLDKDLGKPLAEKDYGGNCKIYDPDKKGDPFHNVKDKLDIFVPFHFFGWWAKMLMFRDWWLCMVISVMFEILEYTLEHQLPNFSECWWDHWIMDALMCNGLGIYLGMITLNYLSMKPYHWRGLWDIPTYRGKLKRILSQFGPRNWIEFDWKPTVTLSRWLSVLSIIAVMLLAELNTFYLKFVLWLHPSHFLNCARLLLLVPGGAVAIREVFQYLDDPDCKELGRQAFVILAIVITEFLIIAKFDFATITKPIPTHVTYFWLIGFLMLLLWTIWTFFIRPAPLKTNSPDVSSPTYNLQHTTYHYECVEQKGNIDPDKEQGIKKDVRQRIQRIQKSVS